MRWYAALLLLVLTPARAEWLALHGGQLRGQYLLASWPEDNVVREAVGTPTQDRNADLRLLTGGGAGGWRWQADYQLILRSGDVLGLGRLDGSALAPGAVFDDDRRLLDLTRVLEDGDDRVLLHRLDRLSIGYTGDKAVLRVGRQAVSWGNGLIYNPVDFFNPFDPAAVDREYKTGDDMVYGQYLEDSGNDWQLVSVWRRDADGDPDPDVNSHALKYHAFLGTRELDLLLARHYGDDIGALGGITDLGGAILRGDLMFTRTAEDDYFSAVVNLSYSWTWWGRNVTGVGEYFFNGFGLRRSDYDELLRHPDLLARLERGELFTVGRHYLAAGLTVEVTPLFNLLPSLFWNAGDGSGLVQLSTRHDLSQDLQLLLSANLPFGADDTEYGGLAIGGSDARVGSGPALFAQLSWYF